jgi:hypothetical protein
MDTEINTEKDTEPDTDTGWDKDGDRGNEGEGEERDKKKKKKKKKRERERAKRKGKKKRKKPNISSIERNPLSHRVKEQQLSSNEHRRTWDDSARQTTAIMGLNPIRHNRQTKFTKYISQINVFEMNKFRCLNNDNGNQEKKKKKKPLILKDHPGRRYIS